MRALIWALLVLTGSVWASNNQEVPDADISIGDISTTSELVSNPVASASAKGEGGAGGAGGSATGGSGGIGGTGGSVVNRNKYERSAPSSVAVPPNNTGECMTGAAGTGSNVTGLLGISFSWLQKDCFALQSFKRLAAMGLIEPAAKAYCSRKLLWSDFDTQANCHSTMVRSLTDAAVDAQPVVVTEVASVVKKTSSPK